MGNRVVEIREYGRDHAEYGVMQSTAGAMFVPVFAHQLQAALFAFQYYRRDLDRSAWSDAGQETLASAVRVFLREKLGHPDAAGEAYDDLFTAVWFENGNARQEELETEFKVWRKAHP